jgi:hypothetical protein
MQSLGETYHGASEDVHFRRVVQWDGLDRGFGLLRTCLKAAVAHRPASLVFDGSVIAYVPTIVNAKAGMTPLVGVFPRVCRGIGASGDSR